ncbi:hypothetical protein GCM10010095_19670 [Streptomyces anthocyanicus]|uniref:hypothetical protein n=1 Tax=Streptomyces anthocyanicus TaxID=68174 RepID=UPI0019C324AB|nr:hypothetical protein [Streptomyces anthocyanicus]GGL34451.1 hypothetical protein GCM10010095_19670 [Streptomyces anthocyanicus]
MVDLVTCAKRHRTSGHTSSRRFIGDLLDEKVDGSPVPAQERRARAWPAIETWLTDGDAFLRQARLSAPHRRPALPVTAPARPVAAARSAYRSH